MEASIEFYTNGNVGNDVVTGPGGSQVLIEDPSGNVVEVFQPAGT